MTSTLKEDNFSVGMALLEAGKRQEAVAVLIKAYESEMRIEIRLQIIDVLLTALNQVRDNQKLLDLTAEAIAISIKLNHEEYRAHFMARRAEYLMVRNGFVQYEQKTLKLAPGWIAFALQRDMDRYKALTTNRQTLDREINDLINGAMMLAEQKDREELLGFILMSKASIASARCMELKGDYLRSESSFLKWFKSGWLRHYLFDPRFILSKKYRNESNNLIASCETDCLKAAELFNNSGSPMAANAYYNLANHLRSAFRFKKAQKYLDRAKAIATANNDVAVLRQIGLLRKIIKARGRDIPNYVEGETRAGY